MQEFAGEGLRTLALAYKDLDEDFFSQWKQRHHEASTALEDRESKLDQLYEEIEKDLLVGRVAAVTSSFRRWNKHVNRPQRVSPVARGDSYRGQVTGRSTSDHRAAGEG